MITVRLVLIVDFFALLAIIYYLYYLTINVSGNVLIEDLI